MTSDTDHAGTAKTVSAEAPRENRFAGLLVWVIAAGTLVLQLATAGRFGASIDELYQQVCADRLAWGFVDQPPLTPVILAWTRDNLGDGLFAMRFLPALAVAFAVVLTARLTRRMGGGHGASALAALVVALAPVYLATGGEYGAAAFNLLFWTMGCVVLVRLMNGGTPYWWFAFGVIVGLGLLNDYAMALFLCAVLLALLLSSHRRALLHWQLWMGLLFALVIILQHILWQNQHEWPLLGFMERTFAWRDIPAGAGRVLFAQFMALNPLAAPVWLGGLLLLFASRRLRRYQVFAILFLLVLAFYMVVEVSSARLAPAFVPLIASGAVVCAEWRKSLPIRALRAGYIVAFVAVGALLLPFAVPVLSVERLLAYQSWFHGVDADEPTRAAALPTHFANRFGWAELTEEVAGMYFLQDTAIRSDGVIWCATREQAIAIEALGAAYRLPRPLTEDVTYQFWRPADLGGEMTIAVGLERRRLETFFTLVELGNIADHPLALPKHRNVPIYLCRELKLPLRAIFVPGAGSEQTEADSTSATDTPADDMDSQSMGEDEPRSVESDATPPNEGPSVPETEP